jgi:hypothetical protein
MDETGLAGGRVGAGRNRAKADDDAILCPWEVCGSITRLAVSRKRADGFIGSSL